MGNDFIYRFVDKIESELQKIQNFEKENQIFEKELLENFRNSKNLNDELSQSIQTHGEKNKKLIDKYKQLKERFLEAKGKIDNNIENPPENKVLELRQAIDILKVFYKIF